MQTIRAHLFEPLADQTPQPVIIIIEDPLPDFSKLFGEIKDQQMFNTLRDQWYQTEAERIFYALWDALPQATMERLGIEFLKRWLSLYRGKMGEG